MENLRKSQSKVLKIRVILWGFSSSQWSQKWVTQCGIQNENHDMHHSKHKRKKSKSKLPFFCVQKVILTGSETLFLSSVDDANMCEKFAVFCALRTWNKFLQILPRWSKIEMILKSLCVFQHPFKFIFTFQTHKCYCQIVFDFRGNDSLHTLGQNPQFIQKIIFWKSQF